MRMSVPSSGRPSRTPDQVSSLPLGRRPSTLSLGSVALAVVAGLAAVVLSACSASLHVSAGVVNADAYNAKWRAAWSAVMSDATPYIPTAASPGVCNVGGTKQGCYDTDQSVIADLHTMSTELTGSVVPGQFRPANRLLQQAIKITVLGLQLRDEAIANNDDRSFQRSRRLLPQGHTLFLRAYSTYPAYARPRPAPVL
jgi:hypothetical protein